MSERERLLSAAEPAPAPGASPAGGDPGLSPAPPHHPTDSVGERRRALTRRFLRNTFACACACATLLACHTQLASVTFGGRVESADDDPSGDASSDASAQSLLAREVVVAAAGVPKSQRYSGSYPPWWNDRASLPDAQPIFIHIPKTGGVSVEDAAAKAGHVTGACVVHAFGDASLPYAVAPGFDCEPYHTPPLRFVPFSFTVVRDPYARMVSEFNWRAMWDERVAEEMRGGKWSFTCGDFEDAVRDHVAQVAENPFFACLSERAAFEARDYESCHTMYPGDPLTDSHAFPQWLFAKNAERVFKYEAFEAEVWPFLESAGVTRAGDGAEKINSAGAVSEVATVEGTSASRDAPRRLDRRGGRAEKASTPARHAPRRFPSLLPLPEKDTFPVAAPLLPPLRSPSPIDPFSFPRRSAPLRPASDRGRRPRVHQRPPPPRGDGDGDG